MLAGLERPLLCSSVHVEAGAGALELPEAAVMLDMFEPRGIDFVVDAGVTVHTLNLPMWWHGRLGLVACKALWDADRAVVHAV